MTSGDGPIIRTSYPPAVPSNHAHDASQASSNSRTTCKGQELFDLGRILNRAESDLSTTRGNRHTVVISQGLSEETDLKDASVCSGAAGSADAATILKTVCMTVESTREGSLAEEDVEAQIIDSKEDSG